MEFLDNDFTTDRYAAILGNLADNDYLSKDDVDILLLDSTKNKSIYLANISKEKAEIVQRALFENRNRIKPR